MKRILVLASCLTLLSCGILQPGIPQPKEEFRGIWIATVANIDWPPRGDMPWEEQKQAFEKILDYYQALNFNTAIVQVRTAGDALYPTDLAPWSRYLTGKEGRPPKTGEDPLEWMIEQTHRRGMQFHAWMNPYRATMSTDTTQLASSHDYLTHPDWMIKYGNRYYYNPGLPEVKEHLVDIIREVVAKYAVDGIHFDDYFYPYKVQGEVFADSLAYQANAFTGQALEDWRRANVDSLIKAVHQTIQEEKPWVQFGISPFGVWRNQDKDPRGSDTRAGQTNYDDLYANPLTWMEESWIDYLVPQLYWSLDFAPASHRTLISWWAGHKTNSRLYIGNGPYKIRNNHDKAWRKKKELPRQLLLARNTENIDGNVFFSARSLPGHADVAKHLRKRYYPHPALPPTPQHVTADTLPAPMLLNTHYEGNHIRFTLKEAAPSQWPFAVVYAARNRKQLGLDDPSAIIDKIFLDGRKEFTLGSHLLRGKRYLALTFLDAYGRESKPITLHLNQINPDD